MESGYNRVTAISCALVRKKDNTNSWYGGSSSHQYQRFYKSQTKYCHNLGAGNVSNLLLSGFLHESSSKKYLWSYTDGLYRECHGVESPAVFKDSLSFSVGRIETTSEKYIGCPTGMYINGLSRLKTSNIYYLDKIFCATHQ